MKGLSQERCNRTLFLFLVLCSPGARADATGESIPVPILRKLAHLVPKSRIAATPDIDVQSCRIDTSGLCVITADINGDKLDDYFLIAITGKPYYRSVKGTTGLPQTRCADVIFLLALGTSNGPQVALREKYYGKESLPYPLRLAVSRQVPGRIRETEDAEPSRSITLMCPGFLLTWCEQSAIVYFWDKSKGIIDKLWISN